MPPALHRSMTGPEWGLLALLSLLWGGTFLFVAVALREIPPVTIVFGRLALAAALLWLVLRLAGQAGPQGAAAWKAVAGMSVLNNVVPFTLIAYGQTQVGAGLAAVLNATTPLFGVVVAHAMTADEKATPARLAGVLIGFAGVAVMVGPSVLDRATGGMLLAQLACLGGALSYAFSGIQGRRLAAHGLTPLASAAGQVTVSSVLLLPAMLLFDRPWSLPVPSMAAIGCVLALAFLSTAVAYLIFFRLLATAGAMNLLLVTFLIPVSAILLGVGLLGEMLEPRQLGGMALIALGLAAIDGRPLAAVRARVIG